MVPLDYQGKLTYWYVGPTEAEPRINHEIDAQFWEAFSKIYPNIEVTKQNLGYNDMLNKVRTAALGRAAPMVARMPIMWGVEFAAKGQLHELAPTDVGHSLDEFWPGAMKSVRWKGKAYGVPTNNETMAFIWNAALFEEAGLDPEKAPETWPDVVSYSRQIKEKTGKNGYGLVARVNAGNTPFRFMPQCWAYGGGALDEAEPDPTYDKVMIDNAGSKAALQASYDMYVRDKSVPVSALTNTQNQNQDPFIAGQLGMMISHPSEYAVMLDRAAKATGSGQEDRRRRCRQHALRLDPEGARAPRRRVRRLQRAHVQPGRGGRIARCGRGSRHDRVLDRPRMVDQDRLDQLEPRQSPRFPDQVDGRTAAADQVPRRPRPPCCRAASRSR